MGSETTIWVNIPFDLVSSPKYTQKDVSDSNHTSHLRLTCQIRRIHKPYLRQMKWQSRTMSTSVA
jgi:hypothetical protein